MPAPPEMTRPTAEDETTMQIETTRFGTLEVPDEEILEFPQGLYGFEALRRWCLLPYDESGRLFWLQAVDSSPAALVLTVPFFFVPDYEVEIPDPAAALLEATAPTDVEIFTTVTVAPEQEGLSLNLLGPVVVNLRSRRGLQVIQDPQRHRIRHLVKDFHAQEAAA